MLAGLLLTALLLPQQSAWLPTAKMLLQGVLWGSLLRLKWLHARVGIEQLKLYFSRCIAGLGAGLRQPCRQSGAASTAHGAESVDSHCGAHILIVLPGLNLLFAIPISPSLVA